MEEIVILVCTRVLIGSMKETETRNMNPWLHHGQLVGIRMKSIS